MNVKLPDTSSHQHAWYFLSLAFLLVWGCEGPVEPIRQNPRDPDYFLGQNVPSPATEFRYENTVTADITFFWEDNSSFEEGFVIEQAVNLDSVFSDIDEVAANATVYQESNLSVSLDTMLYRVRSFLDGRRSRASDTLFLHIPLQSIEGEYTLRAVHPTEKKVLLNSFFEIGSGTQLLLWQPDQTPSLVTLSEDRTVRQAVFDDRSGLLAFLASSTVTLLDLDATGAIRSSFDLPSSFGTDGIRIFSQYQRVLAFSENQLDIWDTGTGNQLVAWEDFDDTDLIVVDAIYDNAGRLWTLSKPGPNAITTNYLLNEWSIQNDSLIAQQQLELNGSRGSVSSGGLFSPGGLRVATFPKSMGVQEVCIWDVATGAQEKCLSTGPEPVLISSVKFNTDASRIFVAFEEGRNVFATSYVQDIATEQIVKRLRTSNQLSTNFRYFTASRRIIGPSGGIDANLIGILDLENGWQQLYARDSVNP